MAQKKTTEDLIAERPSPSELKTMPRVRLSVIADNIRSLDNIGLLFRLCELARVEKLYLTGYTGHPSIDDDNRPKYIQERHQKRIEKTAVYALPHQPWEYHEDPVLLAQNLKAEGSKIIALEQTQSSVPYHHLPTTHYKLPTTLIVGHERRGVRKDLLEIADSIVEIPILGLGNSHNLATATAIILYHILVKTGEV